MAHTLSTSVAVLPEDDTLTIYSISQDLELKKVKGEKDSGRTFRLAAMDFYKEIVGDRIRTQHGFSIEQIHDEDVSRMAKAWMISRHQEYTLAPLKLVSAEKRKAYIIFSPRFSVGISIDKERQNCKTHAEFLLHCLGKMHLLNTFIHSVLKQYQQLHRLNVWCDANPNTIPPKDVVNKISVSP